MKKYTLFDLDGTLTKSGEGITNAVKYALEKFGIHEENADTLRKFIGPPLKDSFMAMYGLTPADAERAVAYYREYYADRGIFECEVYEGIPELLEWLSDNGCVLAVATSKPQAFTERILEHFGIAKYFAVVVGSELDGTRVKKGDVIRCAMEKLGASPRECVMVGDRRHDVQGAAENNIKSVGVMYGYGMCSELMDAGADYIIDEVSTLKSELLHVV